MESCLKHVFRSSGVALLVPLCAVAFDAPARARSTSCVLEGDVRRDEMVVATGNSSPFSVRFEGGAKARIVLREGAPSLVHATGGRMTLDAPGFVPQ